MNCPTKEQLHSRLPSPDIVKGGWTMEDPSSTIGGKKSNFCSSTSDGAKSFLQSGSGNGNKALRIFDKAVVAPGQETYHQNFRKMIVPSSEVQLIFRNQSEVQPTSRKRSEVQPISQNSKRYSKTL
ncbi:hypothetical protein V6N13_040499 [Hibiscus sabdariffa]